MADYYADSSVLVKRHVHELGSAWFRALAEPSSGNVILTARVSFVEVYSAFARRMREAHLSLDDYREIASDFEAACANEYRIVEITPAVVDRARGLLEYHPLRAYDAVQLAAALAANDALQRAGVPTLTFLAADARLLAVAQAEGLTTVDPREHP